MASFYFYFLILFISSTMCSTAEIDLKCTVEFCDEYVQRFPCPPLDPACSNASRAIILPSPTTCNCCDHCFLFKDVGEDCIVGRPGQPLPDIICKPGTECVNGFCVKKKEPDSDFYKGYECEKGICQCTILENNIPKKIFGTFKETEDLEKEKQCECSISAHRSQKLMSEVLQYRNLYPPTPRCLPNGQFDPLQCIDKMCGCVDKATGVWDTSIPKVFIKLLGPGSPECFDEKRHMVGEYYTMCEKERNDLMLNVFEGELDGEDILLSHIVQCTPDGKYVQETIKHITQS